MLRSYDNARRPPLRGRGSFYTWALRGWMRHSTNMATSAPRGDGVSVIVTPCTVCAGVPWVIRGRSPGLVRATLFPSDAVPGWRRKMRPNGGTGGGSRECGLRPPRPASSGHERLSLQLLLPGKRVRNDGGEIIILWCPPEHRAGAIGSRDDLSWIA
jgi:hypothetical protein